MHCLGNDIVDFSLTEGEKKFLDKRFLDRVFSLQEQKMILSATHPNKVLWGLWAVKEAAYKACRQQQPDLYFSPRAFTIAAKHSTFQLSGECYWRSSLCIPYQIVFATDQVIHAIAYLTNNRDKTRVVTGLEYVSQCDTYQQQSYYARSLLCRWAKTQGLEGQVVRLNMPGKKQLGPPRFCSGDQLSDMPISLSHDAHWVGFAAMVVERA